LILWHKSRNRRGDFETQTGKLSTTNFEAKSGETIAISFEAKLGETILVVLRPNY
jgi:hypothetical protein